MKKKIVTLALALSMAVGLAAPALAYDTPDFEDVPADHWAYAAVMEMADAGYIKGTGAGRFSPEAELTAEMFLVLVGRVVFPAVEADGADWSGPYVAAAQEAGVLEGTKIDTGALTDEVSRYDMAVVLSKAAPKLGIKVTKAESWQVADYADVPNRYTDAVLSVYGTGLIQGDQNGVFNGEGSMTRQEAATVLSRLIAMPEEQAQAEAEAKAQEQAELQAWVESSRTGEYVTVKIEGASPLTNNSLLTDWEGVGHMGVYFKDGRLLGETTTKDNGWWEIELTLDKADYERALAEPCLYATFTEPVSLVCTDGVLRVVYEPDSNPVFEKLDNYGSIKFNGKWDKGYRMRGQYD